MRQSTTEYVSIISFEPAPDAPFAAGLAKPPEAVEIFPERKIQRAHHFIGTLTHEEAEGVPDNWVERLRVAAGERGCDALELGHRDRKVNTDVGLVVRSTYFGKCIIFKDDKDVTEVLTPPNP